MMPGYKFIKPSALAVVCAGLAYSAGAQEVLYTPSATSPGEGILATRHNFSFETYEGVRPNGAFTLDQYTVENALAYGITSDLTFMAHFPLTYRDFAEPPGSGSEEFGLEDMSTMFKYRFYQDDIANIDTVRMSAMAGVEIPSFVDGFSSDSFDPFVGFALTAIEGKHGVGAHLKYKLNTGDDKTGIEFDDTEADAMRFDSSYLYRIDPDQYTIDTTESTYVMVELNNRYEVNGDFEMLLSPGLLIEAQTWAAEVAVRIPIARELDNRAELQWALTVGLRFTY